MNKSQKLPDWTIELSKDIQELYEKWNIPSLAKRSGVTRQAINKRVKKLREKSSN